MDLVLHHADNLFLDRFWAYLLPLKVPIDELVLGRSAASLLAKPTSTFVQTALATALPALHYIEGGSQQAWTTVSSWPREDWRRQFLSLCFITMVGVHLMYFAIAGCSYLFLFDHRMMKHPRFLKNQIRMEIKTSLIAFPWLTLMIVPTFLGEARGHSKCYGTMAEGPFGDSWPGYVYLVFSLAFFLWFTDFFIYFIHRYEHHPAVYRHIHKPHHKWVIPTPFASHAFHPVDGYLQSLPYHAFIYLFPLHKLAYLGLFGFVNLWTIAIHDSDMIVDHPLESVINGPAHHTLHHLYFTCNYGQFFTFCDKYFSSYRQPAKGDDPLLTVLSKEKVLDSQQEVLAKKQQLSLDSALQEAEGLRRKAD